MPVHKLLILTSCENQYIMASASLAIKYRVSMTDTDLSEFQPVFSARRSNTMKPKSMAIAGMAVFIGLVVAAALLVTFKPAPTPAPQVVATDKTWLYEATWTAGGDEYKARVNKLAEKYAAVMDQNCKAPNFDVSDASRAYMTWTPAGTERAPDEVIRAQVARLACVTMRGERQANQLLARLM